MKLPAINLTLTQNISNLKQKSEAKESFQEKKPLSNISYRPIFQGLSSRYIKAKVYLESMKAKQGEFNKLATDIYDFNLNKLNGIQEGIKVFEGLNIKEIAFIARSFLEIAVKRGCHNLCSHCYAEAVPPVKENEDTINKMSWEDFSSLTDGFKELNNRLGFYITSPGIFKPNGNLRYSAPFHDADSSELVLKDKNGKEHDFIDIAEKIYESTGMGAIFDTAGWTPKNQEIQTRVEKIIDYFTKKENRHKIDGFNISINPFHILNTKSVFEKRLGHIENSDKFRDFYTTRIANALFTFTPTLKTNQFSPIYRSIAGYYFEGSEGFQNNDLDLLFKEIMSKLKKLYENDLNSDKKYIKNKKQILDNIHEINKIKKQVEQNFTEVGRGIETFGKNNKHYEHALDMKNTYNNDVKEFKTAKNFLSSPFFGIIDANGDYYLTTFWSTYPTKLKLNFANKDKKTAPIKPDLQEDLVITKKVINTTEL